MNSKLKTPILCIEDNSGDFELLKIYLEEAGLKCDLFRNDSLFDGLRMLAERQFDLVLLDLNVTDSSGFKTVTTFLEKAPSIPLIVLTGTNNEIIGNQAVRAGAQDYLVKGQFDSKMLSRVIRYSLQRSYQQLKLEETTRELELYKRRSIEAQEMALFGNWEMDIVTNEMRWSDEVYRIFGWKPGTVQPSLSTYLEYVYSDDKEFVEEYFRNISNETGTNSIEHRLVIEGSSIKYVVLHAKVKVDQTFGKVIVVGGVQDITERKASEKSVLDKLMNFKQARIQEEALTELSFQIRTPLSSIVNLLYLMENNSNGSQRDTLLADMKSSVEDLSKSVSNLMNFTFLFSEDIKLETEEINLKDILQSSVNVLKFKSETAKIQVEFKLDENIPEKIVVDPKKLVQVLYNTLDNAIKFSPDGGKILFNVTASDPHAASFNLLISIKDMGCGMSKNQLSEVLSFNENSEMAEDDDKQPRPMGLVIVDKLVGIMGGSYEIQSKEGIGTTVNFFIPVKASRAARFIANDKPDAPLNILLVEDHFLNQIATKKVLHSWSEFVEVDIAENGVIALDKFENKKYDLILMDIQMPVMNGIDCTLKLREKSDIPIIALTANASKQEQDRCFDAGMNDYLSKPFKPADLYSKIIKILSFVMN